MARPTPLSGFPEWLPSGRIVEQHVLDQLRRTFELHGYAPVATRAVEPLEDLLRKGETSKEVYTISRLHDDAETASARDRQLGLHFDLTVPLARYVLENAGKLPFPFKRYQIQPVWRGERPQEGRFREFLQADIDVIGADELPFHYEVEVALVMAEALAALPIGPVRIAVNNRKVAEGFYGAIGLEDVDAVLRAIDKIDKVGPAAVQDQLLAQGATAEQAKACLDLAAISGTDASVADRVRALGVRSELMETGLSELVAVLEGTGMHGSTRSVSIVADLKIARGLDYYTGTVYETTLVGHESLGSICSGGRYDSLASDGVRTYPGVGLSVGVSRLLARLLGAGTLTASRQVPTAVVVAVTDEARRGASDRVAAALRARGIPTEVSPSAAKFGKQIRYADRRGVPFVWFLGADGAPDQVKDIRSGAQHDADAAAWLPPEEDRWPRVARAEQ